MRIMSLSLADPAILCLACIRSLLTGSRDANRWGLLQPGVDSICRVQPKPPLLQPFPSQQRSPLCVSRIVTVVSHAEHFAQVTTAGDLCRQDAGLLALWRQSQRCSLRVRRAKLDTYTLLGAGIRNCPPFDTFEFLRLPIFILSDFLSRLLILLSVIP
jgi:hypothetical protein